MKEAMTKFQFDDDVPALIRPDLEKYFLPLEPLIPDWCNRVYVSWQGGDSSNGRHVMQNSVNYRYRWARITVHGRWTDQPEDGKRGQVIHELLHIAVDPLYHWIADRIVDLTKGDDRLNQILSEGAAERVEMVTEDLKQIMLRCSGV